MKNFFFLSVLFSFALLISCSEEIDIEVAPTTEDTQTSTAISANIDIEYSAANVGNADFSIDNEDNIVYEQDALLLSNNSVNAVSYHWDFGNGKESTLANPSFTYDIHGYYTVTLTTTDAEGNIHEASDEILVLCLFGGGNHDQ